MAKRSGTPGYCSSCTKNTPHLRLFHSRIIWTLDLLTLRIARIFRIGPWYCMQCEGRRTILRPVRRSAGSYRPEDHGNFTSDTPQTSGELIGNYIRTDQSLVIRRNRASRYSLKYRDGIVQRILGGATFSQLSHELNVSEQDLVDWIADTLARKQERIDELKAMVDLLQRAQGSQDRLGHTGPVVVDDGKETIDGQVRSRS